MAFLITAVQSPVFCLPRLGYDVWVNCLFILTFDLLGDFASTWERIHNGFFTGVSVSVIGRFLAQRNWIFSPEENSRILRNSGLWTASFGSMRKVNSLQPKSFSTASHVKSARKSVSRWARELLHVWWLFLPMLLPHLGLERGAHFTHFPHGYHYLESFLNA